MTSADWLSKDSEAIKLRREICGIDPENSERWGLALSGGGIRSATFCLGVIKAFAKNGLLTRFDYLSTVSGGGYAGAALGRLFQAVDDPAKVQSELAKDDRLFWWWLRKNGRYLFPAGVKDGLFAGSTLVRNLTAIYFDLFLVGVLIACVMILPHLVGMEMGSGFSRWTGWSPSAWWILAAAMPTLFLMSTWAYWFSASRRRLRVEPASIAFGGVGLLVSLIVIWPSLAHQLLAFSRTDALTCADVVADTNPAIYALWALGCLSPISSFALLQLSLSLPLAVVAAWLAGSGATPSQALDPAVARNRLTRCLMYVLDITIVLVIAAAIDMLSWWIAGTLIRGWTVFAASGGGLLVLIATSRATLLWLKDLRPGAVNINLARVANIAGLILGFLFLLLCATFVQVVVFYGGGFTTGPPPVNEPEIWATQSVARLVLVALPCLIYILLTGRNLASLNASSLHNFYRARLTRSYVSVGNPERGFKPNALVEAAPGTVDALMRVSDVVAHDDLPFADYQPHAHGGPLHLVNVCFNQTVNDRTGEFNRDRQGRNMTLGSAGCDLGSPRQSIAIQYQDGSGPTLGQWIAISGAAAAPGMGSHTSKGLASLLTLCGIRLGYWLDVVRTNGTLLKDSTFPRRALPKYAHLLDEMLATFPSSDDRHWYVSDGGHFENTGVYALLKREVDVIVVADCGADPAYAFDDLNKLVRMARIDFDAEIIFQQPDQALAKNANLDISPFGTLAEISESDSSSFLVMARVKYASGKTGQLVIVKPTMIGTLPLDLMAYKSSNPAFPQETTADQFFDEAQWESYFRLGEELGSSISDKLLGNLPAISRCFTDQLGTGIVASGPARLVGATRTQPKFAGQVVKSSLGIGAVIGLLFSFYQVWDQQRSNASSEQRQFSDAVNQAIEKSVDSQGNLRVSDAGILLLRGMVKPGEALRTDLDMSLVQSLIGRLNAMCSKELADDKAGAQCKELATLAQPFDAQGGSMMTAYWPGWPKQEKADVVTAVSDKVVSAPTTSGSVSAPSSKMVPLPATPPSVGTPIDLRIQISKPERLETQAKSAASASKASEAASSAPAKVAAKTTVTEKPTAQPQASIDPILDAKYACERPAGSQVRLYTQVYGPGEFKVLTASKTQPPANQLSEFISIEAVEDVNATAIKLGTRSPYRWSAPTLIYHNETERACAEKLATVYETEYGPKPNVRPLPERLKKQAGVIELWVPIDGASKLTAKPLQPAR